MISRDPRIRTKAIEISVPSSRRLSESEHVLAKRNEFIHGTLKADEVIRTTERIAGYHDKRTEDLKRKIKDYRGRMERNPTSFYANIPQESVVGGGYKEFRSPLIAGSNNPLFVSQATQSNVLNALVGQRYRNIPKELQLVGQRVGVDLDGISQSLKVEVSMENASTEIAFVSLNQRTIGTQTESSGIEKKNTETQTTNNSGGFIFIPDIRKLNDQEKQALQDFKEVKFRFLIRAL